MSIITWVSVALSVGFCVGLVLARKLGADELISESRWRTPVKIKDGFYYIVPEGEYVENQGRLRTAGYFDADTDPMQQ